MCLPSSSSNHELPVVSGQKRVKRLWEAVNSLFLSLFQTGFKKPFVKHVLKKLLIGVRQTPKGFPGETWALGMSKPEFSLTSLSGAFRKSTPVEYKGWELASFYHSDVWGYQM